MQNFEETSGYSLSEVDFVFGIFRDASPQIRKALDEAKKKYQFRVLECPYNFSLENQQLILMDWMLHYGNIRKWFLIYHSDWLWLSNNWLKTVVQSIENYTSAVYFSYPYGYGRYIYKGKHVFSTTDSFACFNKKYLIDNKLSFKWGLLSELSCSSRLKDNIDKKNIYSTVGKRYLDYDFWLDGSELIGLELICRNLDLIKVIPKLRFFHPWGIFRTAVRCKLIEDTIIVEDNLWPLAFYSKLSSYLFDLSSFQKPLCPFPWILCKSLPKFFPFIKMEDGDKIVDLYQKYSTVETNILGDSNIEGIKTIILKEEEFKIINDCLFPNFIPAL